MEIQQIGFGEGFTASRTFETILVSEGMEKKAYYVYNKDSLYYYLFDNLADLIYFFSEPNIDHDVLSYKQFESEQELDKFIESNKFKPLQ